MFLGFQLLFPLPEYARAMTFKEYINQPCIKEQSNNDIRIEWEQYIGGDIWKGYFLIKDIETDIKEHTVIKVGRLKGKLNFGNDYKYIEYRFQYKF
jgi:hypothetical protein